MPSSGWMLTELTGLNSIVYTCIIIFVLNNNILLYLYTCSTQRNWMHSVLKYASSGHHQLPQIHTNGGSYTIMHLYTYGASYTSYTIETSTLPCAMRGTLWYDCTLVWLIAVLCFAQFSTVYLKRSRILGPIRVIHVPSSATTDSHREACRANKLKYPYSFVHQGNIG